MKGRVEPLRKDLNDTMPRISYEYGRPLYFRYDREHQGSLVCHDRAYDDVLSPAPHNLKQRIDARDWNFLNIPTACRSPQGIVHVSQEVINIIRTYLPYCFSIFRHSNHSATHTKAMAPKSVPLPIDWNPPTKTRAPNHGMG